MLESKHIILFSTLPLRTSTAKRLTSEDKSDKLPQASRSTFRSITCKVKCLFSQTSNQESLPISCPMVWLWQTQTMIGLILDWSIQRARLEKESFSKGMRRSSLRISYLFSTQKRRFWRSALISSRLISRELLCGTVPFVINTGIKLKTSEGFIVGPIPNGHLS
jgi:hypothetical protein